MAKFTRYEGDSYSRLRQMMTKAGSKPSGVRIELATVIASPPELKVRRDSDQLILEKEELVVAEQLTRHTRIVSVNYQYPLTLRKDTDIGDIDADTSSSRNNVGQASPNPYEKYEMSYATMQFEDLLLEGDRVLLACDDDNMVYYVLDRAVWYK